MFHVKHWITADKQKNVSRETLGNGRIPKNVSRETKCLFTDAEMGKDLFHNGFRDTFTGQFQ